MLQEEKIERDVDNLRGEAPAVAEDAEKATVAACQREAANSAPSADLLNRLRGGECGAPAQSKTANGYCTSL